MNTTKALLIANAIEEGCKLIAAAIRESGPDQVNDAIVALENVAQSITPMPGP